MITRNCLTFHTVLLLAIGQVASAGDLHLAADKPTVTVETRSDGRNFIHLPALQYTIRIEAACAEERKPARLSLNVADTRVLLSEDRIVSGTAFDVPLLIPSSQIGPIAVEGFCLADAGEFDSARETMTVPSVLSIQAALLCTGDSGDEMDYASTALDVILECARPQDDSTGTDASVTARQMPVKKVNGS